MKPCPFCGKAADMDDGDTLYPIGIYWRESEYDSDERHYIGHKEHNPYTDHPCYGMHCPESSGGCGVEVTGDSRQEAIDNWNRRVYTSDMTQENENFTRVTLQDKYGTYTIEVPYSDLSIDEMLSKVISPLLKAATYPSKLVDEYINPDITGD